MRKIFVLLLLTGLILLQGCAMPAKKDSNNAVNKDVGTAAQKDGSKDIDNEKGRSDAERKDSKEGIKEKNEEQKTAETAKISVTLYYQDSEGSLIPVTRRFEKQDGIARAAVNSLIDTALNREAIQFYELYPVLPEGTKILGINIKDGTATIDFGKKLLNYNNEASERNMIASVVYTLTGFKTVNNVRILVNGYPQNKLKFNTDISNNLGRDNVNINTDKFNVENGSGKLDVYLFKKISDSHTYLLPVSIEASGMKPEDVPTRIIDTLAGKSGNGKLYSAVPSRTKLLGSSINDSTLTLDFNGELRKYGGNTREDGILKQILYSMKQIKGIQKVNILIEGKKGTLPEGTEIEKAIPIPVGINEVLE